MRGCADHLGDARHSSGVEWRLLRALRQRCLRDHEARVVEGVAVELDGRWLDQHALGLQLAVLLELQGALIRLDSELVSRVARVT